MNTKIKRPSKLETMLAASIKIAKLQKRVSELEARVLELDRKRLFESGIAGSEISHFRGPSIYDR